MNLNTKVLQSGKSKHWSLGLLRWGWWVLWGRERKKRVLFRKETPEVLRGRILHAHTGRNSTGTHRELRGSRDLQVLGDVGVVSTKSDIISLKCREGVKTSLKAHVRSEDHALKSGSLWTHSNKVHSQVQQGQIDLEPYLSKKAHTFQRKIVRPVYYKKCIQYGKTQSGSKTVNRNNLRDDIRAGISRQRLKMIVNIFNGLKEKMDIPTEEMRNWAQKTRTIKSKWNRNCNIWNKHLTE